MAGEQGYTLETPDSGAMGYGFFTVEDPTGMDVFVRDSGFWILCEVKAAQSGAWEFGEVKRAVSGSWTEN